MESIKLPNFKLVGIKLDGKTTNKKGQSNIDCGELWQKFETENLINTISGKLSSEIFAVYYDFEGDHAQAFSYFIGCKVEENANTPKGLHSLYIPEQKYCLKPAKGKMPNCVSNAWKEIRESEQKRSFDYDFEVYDERSQDWEDAIVDIYLSVK